MHLNLLSGLLKDIAGVLLAAEIADALGANDAAGPVACHKVVEAGEVHGAAAVIDKGAYAIFQRLALAVVMVVAVAMLVVAVVAVVMVMVVVMMFVFIAIFILIFLSVIVLYLADPGSRGGHALEIEHPGVDDFLQGHVAEVAGDDFCVGLQGAYDLAYPFQFGG